MDSVSVPEVPVDELLDADELDVALGEVETLEDGLAADDALDTGDETGDAGDAGAGVLPPVGEALEDPQPTSAAGPSSAPVTSGPGFG